MKPETRIPGWRSMVRGKVSGKSDEAHLGYVFNDAPLEKGGYRYTINSAVVNFTPVEQLTPQLRNKYFPEMMGMRK